MNESYVVTPTELKKFLKTMMLPELSSDWKIFRKDTLIRVYPFFCCGIHFYRLRGERIRPMCFFQLFSIPYDDIDLTLSLFIKEQMKGFWGRISKTKITYIFDWKDNETASKYMIGLIKDQMPLFFDVEISTTAINAWLEERFIEAKHPRLLWTRGSVLVLTGQKEIGIKLLTECAQLYHENASSYSDSGYDDRAENDRIRAKEVEKLIHSVENDNFLNYSEKIAAKTRAAIGV